MNCISKWWDFNGSVRYKDACKGNLRPLLIQKFSVKLFFCALTVTLRHSSSYLTEHTSAALRDFAAELRTGSLTTRENAERRHSSLH